MAAGNWTLLVQGLNLHAAAAAAMLERFRFVPEARLDDVMMSYASAGGGVGPHVDNYDVFLLQVNGRRRWRIAPPGDARFRPGQPLRLLARFTPSEEWLLEPGDMLYLPPHWGHDGLAVGGECMTCSIGFRAPGPSELCRELLARLSDAMGGDEGARYADPGAPATAHPGAIPAALGRYAARSLANVLREPKLLAVALGEFLSEPKREVWFAAGSDPVPGGAGVRLDRRTRMLYDREHLFVNGEAFVLPAPAADAAALRRLADRRALDGAPCRALGAGARALLRQWARAGWLHGEPRDE
jgi:50S ribosomal protein L16 3-hydroxylase